MFLSASLVSRRCSFVTSILGALDDTPTASSGAAMTSRLITSCPVLETLHLEWDLECHHHGAQEVFHICSSSLKYLTMSIGFSVAGKWHAAGGVAAALATLQVTAPSLAHLSFQITSGTAGYKFGSDTNEHDGITFTYGLIIKSIRTLL
ncbi:unnamed protein product [Linum trigynum]|uniref:Uncharacterized protein n=1 Tax=Linum trigynum TaxID=586398 RepID=A0AAV2CXU9_9ROSI